jgi:adenylate kinase
MTHRLLFLGPPGAGKGTQAQQLASSHQLLHLSTGDLLRAELKAGTPLGLEAEAVMNRGELVSDDLVLAIVRSRLISHQGGWLLDGFPRNLPQAKALDELLNELNQPLQQVLLMELNDDELVQRLLARGRADDNEAVIRHRLQVYRDQTAPLIDYYKGRGQLLPIQSTGSIESVAALIAASIGAPVQ